MKNEKLKTRLYDILRICTPLIFLVIFLGKNNPKEIWEWMLIFWAIPTFGWYSFNLLSTLLPELKPEPDLVLKIKN